MRAEIKSWFVEELYPIEDWQPEDPFEVEFWCTLEIGDTTSQIADCFRVHIVAEKAVRHLNSKEYMFVIPQYESWEATLVLLEKTIAGFEDVSWSGLAEQLSEYFHWEYHNYIY